jgi:hypothetical protein
MGLLALGARPILYRPAAIVTLTAPGPAPTMGSQLQGRMTFTQMGVHDSGCRAG